MKLYDYNLYDVINRGASCYDKRVAWYEVDSDKNISFGEYKKDVDALAAGLIEKGLKKGDRIAVIAQNNYEYFVIYGAAAATGTIVLPVNWRLSEDEISFILNDCTPLLIFAGKSFYEIVKKEKLNFDYELFHLDSYSDIENLMNSKKSFIQKDISSDDDFVIIHTAAVAGDPRGAVLSHNNLLFSILHIITPLIITEKDVHLNILPIFHIAGLSMVLSSFHAGALNINMSSFNAVKAAELIEEKKASFLYEFTPILSLIMEEAEKNNKNIKSLRAVTGIDTPDTIKKYQDITSGNFYPLYGQTETSNIATTCKYNDMPGSAGKMGLFSNVKVFDEQDKELPCGQAGEIVVRGPLVFKGYWNLPQDNEYTFREGWHHTGDMGYFDEDGYLWYKGRTPQKELIKTGGENVYPAEVEKVILQNEKVEKAVVFGVPHPKWKEAIKAVCQLKKGESLSEEELKNFVADRIASFKKPQVIEFTDNMPFTDNGFIDREKVKEIYA
jgi:acyl-CoA synthetase (AMP-forming)/AMP-acid ligase II